MKLIYSFIYLLALPLAIPLFIYRILIRGKYRESAFGILGFRKPLENPGAPLTFWIHAVSVGEVNAAAAMVREIRRVFPEVRIVLSTITETGQSHARKTLGDKLDDIFYFPVDFLFLVRRFLDRVQPSHFIMMETELWPNMLLSAAERGVRIYLMNGKLSPKSYRRYMTFRWLFKKPLRDVSAFCMQTRTDGARMARLSGRRDAVHVTGNCKFDTPMKALDDEERLAFRRAWKIDERQRLVVVGSTHTGEEDIMLRAFDEVRREIPEVVFVLAPRHPERFDEVYDLLSQRGLRVLRVTDAEAGPEAPDVVLIDKIGILQRAYGAGEAAILAGSFVPIGGYNLLEAAIHRIPVIYGPHMHKQREILRIFAAFEGGLQVERDQLGDALTRVLQDSKYREELGGRALETVKMSKGTARRNVQVILECEKDLPHNDPGPDPK